jgi:hypothetical protein
MANFDTLCLPYAGAASARLRRILPAGNAAALSDDNKSPTRK